MAFFRKVHVGAMEEVVRLGSDFFHFGDLCVLAQVGRTLHATVANIWQIDQKFKKLEVHGLDSSSHRMDIVMSDFLLTGERASVKKFLFSENRFSSAESLVLYNFEEAEGLLKRMLIPRVKESLKSLELHNVVCLESLKGLEDLKDIHTLKIGLNLSSSQSVETIQYLKLNKLKFLEIRGLAIRQDHLDWLFGTLCSIESLAFLRVTCCLTPDVAKSSALQASSVKWKSKDLLSLEIMSATETSMSDIERIVFSDFANKILDSGDGLDNVQTFTLNCSPCRTVWEWLTKSTQLMHLVVTNCDKTVDLKLLAEIVKRNASNFQIFVVKFAGSTNIHLDSIVQLILSASLIPPLERLELEVTMDETNCIMEAPYHTLKAATTLRCRYRDHMHFFRTKYGVYMASERAFCTDTEFDYASVTSPMELFREEMVKGMMDNPYDSAALEAEMINQWNAIHQIARSIYVEIFDEFVERFITGPSEWPCDEKPQDNSELCDVAATIANLRE